MCYKTFNLVTLIFWEFWFYSVKMIWRNWVWVCAFFSELNFLVNGMTSSKDKRKKVVHMDPCVPFLPPLFYSVFFIAALSLFLFICLISYTHMYFKYRHFWLLSSNLSFVLTTMQTDNFMFCTKTHTQTRSLIANEYMKNCENHCDNTKKNCMGRNWNVDLNMPKRC